MARYQDAFTKYRLKTLVSKLLHMRHDMADALDDYHDAIRYAMIADLHDELYAAVDSPTRLGSIVDALSEQMKE